MSGRNHSTVCCLLTFLALAAGVCLPPEARCATTTYATRMQTSAGNPVTDVMIWETDGVSSYVDYAFELPGSGVGLLSHSSLFAPTRTLVVGQTLGVDAEGADKAQIVMFLDGDFADGNVGRKFSEVFPNTRHSVFLSQLEAAVNDDADALDWFENTFFPGDGLAGSFATGDSFTVAEFTTLGQIGGGITAGTWSVDSIVYLEAVQHPPVTAADLARAVIGETAPDLGPYDLAFVIGNVVDPSATGAFEKAVLNDSGQRWTGFEILLGSGLGDQFAPSTGGDFVGFSETFLAQGGVSASFSNVSMEEDRLLFSGGVVLPGETAEFEFHVTAPIDQMFTLRQIAIPEPGAPTLLTLCGLIAGLRRPRRVGKRH